MPRRRPPSRAPYNPNVSFGKDDANISFSLNRLRDKVDVAVSVASESAAEADVGVDDFFAALEDDTTLEAGEQYAEFEQGLFGQGGGSLSNEGQTQYNEFVEGLEG